MVSCEVVSLIYPRPQMHSLWAGAQCSGNLGLTPQSTATLIQRRLNARRSVRVIANVRPTSRSAVDLFDSNRTFIPQDSMPIYVATDAETASEYGRTVRAIELSNVQYKIRFG